MQQHLGARGGQVLVGTPSWDRWPSKGDSRTPRPLPTRAGTPGAMWGSRKTRSQPLGSLCAKPGGNRRGRRALAALPGYDTHGFPPPLAKMTSAKEVLAQGFLTEPFMITRACASAKSLCQDAGTPLHLPPSNARGIRAPGEQGKQRMESGAEEGRKTPVAAELCEAGHTETGCPALLVLPASYLSSHPQPSVRNAPHSAVSSAPELRVLLRDAEPALSGWWKGCLAQQPAQSWLCKDPFYPMSVFYQHPNIKHSNHPNKFSILFSPGSFAALKCRCYVSVLPEPEERICSHSHPRKCLSPHARALPRGARALG